jgi:hypothetical protein
MRDFIEHDGPGGAAEHRANRKALAKSARAHGISTEAAQELLEVFGHDAQTKQMLESWYAANDGGGDHEVRSAILVPSFCLCGSGGDFLVVVRAPFGDWYAAAALQPNAE